MENESAGSEAPESQRLPSESPWARRIGTPKDDYILPDSAEHVYTRDELSGLSEEELRLARNEIYAVHGRKFTSQDLQEYFSAKEWYKGEIEAETFDAGVLNQTELANLKLLAQMEEEKKGGQVRAPAISIQDFPEIDGSTATLPLSHALYRLCTGAGAQEAETAVSHGKTSTAWMRLLNRIKKGPESAEDAYSPKLVIAYEPSEVLKEEFKALGDQVEVKAIGRDALVFMANQSNPVSSLTAEQIVEIYTGRVQNWKEIGGEDREILAFQRPENSGSQNLMEKLVMKDIPMEEAPKEFIVQEMGELLEEVSAYDNEGNALGYSVYFYASNMYERPELKFMAVDGVMPDRDTIRNGNYPFVNDFYAAIPAYLAADDPARILYEWLTSEDGQGLINGLGYVGATFKEADLEEELALMDTRTMHGGTYSLKERRWVETGGRQASGLTEESIYELAYSFSDNHPEILAAYGCRPEDVQVFYASDSAPPVMLLTQGQTEHYYTALGEYMFSYERRPAEEGEYFWRAPYQVDSQVSYLQVFNGDEEYVLVYDQAKQIKKLEDDERGRIGTVGHWFYTRISGNYVYIYNNEDQVCGKFLTDPGD